MNTENEWYSVYKVVDGVPNYKISRACLEYRDTYDEQQKVLYLYNLKQWMMSSAIQSEEELETGVYEVKTINSTYIILADSYIEKNKDWLEKLEELCRNIQK
jgi:hypothetical protein